MSEAGYFAGGGGGGVGAGGVAVGGVAGDGVAAGGVAGGGVGAGGVAEGAFAAGGVAGGGVGGGMEPGFIIAPPGFSPGFIAGLFASGLFFSGPQPTATTRSNTHRTATVFLIVISFPNILFPPRQTLSWNHAICLILTLCRRFVKSVPKNIWGLTPGGQRMLLFRAYVIKQRMSSAHSQRCAAVTRIDRPRCCWEMACRSKCSSRCIPRG